MKKYWPTLGIFKRLFSELPAHLALTIAAYPTHILSNAKNQITTAPGR